MLSESSPGQAISKLLCHRNCITSPVDYPRLAKALSQEKQKLEKTAQRMGAEIDRLYSQLNNVLNKSEKQKADLKELQIKLEDKTAELKNEKLEHDNTRFDYSAAVDHKRHKIDALQIEVEKLERQLRFSEGSRDVVNGINDELRKKNKALEDMLKQAGRTIQELQLQLSQVQEQQSRAMAAIANAQMELDNVH